MDRNKFWGSKGPGFKSQLCPLSLCDLGSASQSAPQCTHLLNGDNDCFHFQGCWEDCEPQFLRVPTTAPGPANAPCLPFHFLLSPD